METQNTPKADKKTVDVEYLAFQQLNIFQRMLAATAEINKVAKNLSVGTGQSSYKAVGEADVLAAVKPMEAQFGIYSFPFSRKIIKDEVRDRPSQYDSTKKEYFMRVETVYRFVNSDNPTDYIDITTYGDGVDTLDKSPGKAMTYGDKYALLKAYKIETGDDPDQFHSDDNGQKTVKDKESPTPKHPPKSVNNLTPDTTKYTPKEDKNKPEQYSSTDVFDRAKKNKKPNDEPYDPTYNQAQLNKIALDRKLKMEEIVNAIVAATGKQKRANQLTEAEFKAVLEAL